MNKKDINWIFELQPLGVFDETCAYQYVLLDVANLQNSGMDFRSDSLKKELKGRGHINPKSETVSG